MHEKATIERLQYGKDWTDFLLPGETISSVQITSTPDGLTLEDPIIFGNYTLIWVSGGVVGKAYRITFVATMNTGAIAADSLLIKIVVK